MRLMLVSVYLDLGKSLAQSITGLDYVKKARRKMYHFEIKGFKKFFQSFVGKFLKFSSSISSLLLLLHF